MKTVCFYFALLLTISISAQEYTEKQIQVEPLIQGTLLANSKKPDTLAIIIGGSGPTDRDGNQRMSQNNSLKKLGQGLAANGISTFRYDKRIFAMMRMNALVEERINFDDFVNDAVTIINYLKAKDYKTIILIGHSQGALVASLAAQQTEVSQIISLAGAAQPIDKIILDQLEVQAPGLVENAQEAFKDLKETGKAEKFSPGLYSLLRPSVQPFMRSWMQYNPAQELSKVLAPTLIVNGSKDLQVPEKEATLLKIASPEARFVLIKNMNHVLKIIQGDDLENSKSYNEPYRPVSPELLELITQFIRGHYTND